MEETPAPDAVEARPWRSEDGPAPRMHSYPSGARPILRIRTGGIWRLCPVRARADWPDGRIAYHVDVPGEDMTTVARAFWWDPAVMRPASSG